MYESSPGKTPSRQSRGIETTEVSAKIVHTCPWIGVVTAARNGGWNPLHLLNALRHNRSLADNFLLDLVLLLLCQFFGPLRSASKTQEKESCNNNVGLHESLL